MRPIVICGTQGSYGGYGQAAEQFGRQLEAAGIPVRFRPSFVDDRYGPLSDWVRPRVVERTGDAWSIFLDVPTNGPDLIDDPARCLRFTMWETTRFPSDFIRTSRRYAAVAAPCLSNIHSLAALEANDRLYVIPLGVDADTFRPDGRPRSGPFTFATAGRFSHGGNRKGIDELVSAFREAFPDDENVRLHVKVFPDCPFRCDDRRVVFARACLKEDDLVRWTRDSDWYVSLARGEGWGLHTLQAMACGIPVMGLAWAGSRDLIDPTCGAGLPFEYEPCSLTSDWHSFRSRGGHWAGHASGLTALALRAARMAGRDDRWRELSEGARRRALSLSWAAAGHRLMAVLGQIGAIESGRDKAA